MTSEPLLVKPEEELDLSKPLKLLAELAEREIPSWFRVICNPADVAGLSAA